jgi:RNA polymerase sigma factor (sigma-70 family)
MDSELLEMFLRTRDEEAFAAVVKRHGPMVLGVCRRILRNSADADDAFQAAFLVLARRAASLGSPDQLAPWLYGVAFNTARKLRRTLARRAVREGQLDQGCEPPAPSTGERDELLALLDEELTQLPERYRTVVVLCDLEGLTRR